MKIAIEVFGLMLGGAVIAALVLCSADALFEAALSVGEFLL